MTAMYCAPSDIRENVAGTDAGTGTCAQLSDAQLTAAIVQASAKVAAYAGTDFTADALDPVVVVPQLIFTVTLQLATFYATVTYRKGKDLSQYDPVLLGYQDAIRTLTDISSGKIDISPTAPNDPTDEGGHIRNTIPKTFRLSDSGVEYDGRGGVTAAGAGGGLLRDGWY